MSLSKIAIQQAVTDACMTGDIAALTDICRSNPISSILFKGRDGATVLHRLAHSAGADPIGCMEVLISHGAPLNLRDNRGKTPLMHAADTGQDNIVNYLVEKGANLNFQDINGDTAIIAAADKLWMNIMSTLVSHGADMKIRNKAGLSAQLICQEKSDTDEMVKEFLNMVALTEINKLMSPSTPSIGSDEAEPPRRKIVSL